MPSCRPDLIPEVLYTIMEMTPKTILDIGMGTGKWGVLCHEYLKYWKNCEIKIDGVEPHKAYYNPAYDCYNSIFYNDIRDILDIVKCYDLALMIDVIEHLPREDGEQLLKTITSHYIVVTPNYWSGQGTMFGNIHEQHMSRWTIGDFANARLIKDRINRTHIFAWK